MDLEGFLMPSLRMIGLGQSPRLHLEILQRFVRFIVVITAEENGREACLYAGNKYTIRN